MANTKVSALTGLSSVASGDTLYIVDVSDTTDGADGTSKKIARSDLVSGLAASGANTDITSLAGLTTPLTVAQGGSGAATLTGILKGNGTSAFTAVTAPSGTIVGTTDSQELTNKTLTAPVISAAQFTTQAYFDAEVDDGNSSTADTIDWTTGNKHKSTVTGDVVYTFTAPSGPTNLILKLVNGGSQNPSWPATVKWAGGAEPTWTASGTDIVAFYFDGTNYYGQASLNFS